MLGFTSHERQRERGLLAPIVKPWDGCIEVPLRQAATLKCERSPGKKETMAVQRAASPQVFPWGSADTC